MAIRRSTSIDPAVSHPGPVFHTAWSRPCCGRSRRPVPHAHEVAHRGAVLLGPAGLGEAALDPADRGKRAGVPDQPSGGERHGGWLVGAHLQHDVAAGPRRLQVVGREGREVTDHVGALPAQAGRVEQPWAEADGDGQSRRSGGQFGVLGRQGRVAGHESLGVVGQQPQHPHHLRAVDPVTQVQRDEGGVRLRG